MIVLVFPWRIVCLAGRSVSLALAQLWRHKLRSMLTTLGIIIGVTSVCAVIAGLSGLEAIVLGDFQKLGADRVDVYNHRPSSGPDRFLPWDQLKLRTKHFAGLIENCPSLLVFSRLSVHSLALKSGATTLENITVTGIDPGWHKVRRRSVVAGRPFCHIDQLQARRVCLITEEARDTLKLDRDCLGQTVIVDSRPFQVVGIVEAGEKFDLFQVTNANIDVEVLTPLETIYVEDTDGLGGEALAKSPELAEEAAAEMRFFMRRTREIPPGRPDNFEVQTTKGMLDQFRTISTAAKAVAAAVVSLSLLVGGISVMNIMLVSVNERTREIGLRMAVGAHPVAIAFQFIVESVVLSAVGGALGVSLAYLVAIGLRNIPGIDLSRAAVPLWAVALSFGFTSTVGLFFGIFPAIKAARLDPIEALRHE